MCNYMNTKKCFTREFIDKIFNPNRSVCTAEFIGEMDDGRVVPVIDKNGTLLYKGLCYRGCMVPTYSDEHSVDLSAMEQLTPSPGGGIIICSYPRSGNQWIFETVKTIQSAKPEPVLEPMFEFSFLENATKFHDGVVCPPLIYTHFTPDVIPPQILHSYKIINIIRNPKDVAVSFYNLLQNLLLFNYSGTWDAFIDMFMGGRVPYGSWFDYTKKWEIYTEKHKVFTVSYECLTAHYTEEVRRLAAFVGTDVGTEFCEKMKINCSFERTKKLKLDNLPDFMKAMWKDRQCTLLRKGITGDWKNWFTVAQNEQFNTLFHSSTSPGLIARFPLTFADITKSL